VKTLRSLAFNLGFWSWTLAMAIVGIPLLALPRRFVMGHARIWMAGTQAMLKTLVGLDYEVRGREHVPGEPAILAFKHQSAWETLVLLLVVDDPAIALKRELTLIPVFGWYTLRAGMIRIDRSSGAAALRSMVEGARAALLRGSPVVIFPEGTRVAPGAHRPYHPGVAALYLQLDRPVVPVALNSGLFWPRRRFIRRPGTIVVEILDPIPPGLERKEFIDELQARIEAASDRLRTEGEAQLAALERAGHPRKIDRSAA
jgi:1-acyl-sn-glycerol-3-phosphate acyltransferase